MAHTSMTYGTLPRKDRFVLAFRNRCRDTGRFEVRRDPFYGDYDFTQDELWESINLKVDDFNHGDAQAGDWASCVLSVLGFEWI